MADIAGSAHASSPAIEARHLGVALGATPIVSDVSFAIARGEAAALLGQNGSGKSTLMRTLISAVPPARGSVHILGHDMAREPRPALARIGYVPQRVARAAGVPATALEVVRTGLLKPGHLRAHRGRAARNAALAALDAVGLSDRAHDHVQTFSGGQAQRVMIARALVRQPEVLLLDEPLAGIDSQSREHLARLLHELKAEGVTMLIVLHEMGELASLITRSLELEAGRLIYDGPARDIDTCRDEHHPHMDTDSSRPAHHAPPMLGRRS